MSPTDETALVHLIENSMLPGQDGIKIRAFLAFNRSNPLATTENIQALQSRELIRLHEDMIYPVESIADA